MNCQSCSVQCVCTSTVCVCLPECQCTCNGGAGIVEAHKVTPEVIPEERDLAEALIEITQKYGKFNSDDTGVWAGYTPGSENELAGIGVKCGNCVMYEGGTSCKIIAAPVDSEGYCRFAVIPDGVVTAAASKPAPKKDRIHGSDANKKGSASGGKRIVFSDKVEKALTNKVEEHNKKASEGRKATLSMLKAVYRRGAGAFSSSHRPGMGRDQWAMARVNAYLRLLRTGRPANPNYKQDNDLLPAKHPKSSRKDLTITAAAAASAELIVHIESKEAYMSPEHAILRFTEFSGLDYDSVPIFRAAWVRAVAANEDPYERTSQLAITMYNSKDADLLPRKETGNIK